MTKIEATGVGKFFRRAERATVSANIKAGSPDRAESVREAARLHAAVVARAQSLQQAGAATSYEATPLSTYEWSDDANPRRFATTATIQVTLQDLDLVSSLTTELADEGVTATVAWALTDETRRDRERAARQEAVRQSRTVADDYAEALGQKVVEVVSVTDQWQGFGPAARFMAADAGLFAGPVEVTVPDIEVSATVVATYSAE